MLNVPLRPVALPERLSLTGFLADETTVPLASSTATVTAGEITASVNAFVGCWENTSFTGVGGAGAGGAGVGGAGAGGAGVGGVGVGGVGVGGVGVGDDGGDVMVSVEEATALGEPRRTAMACTVDEVVMDSGPV